MRVLEGGGDSVRGGSEGCGDLDVAVLDAFWDVVVQPDRWPSRWGRIERALWSKELRGWLPAREFSGSGFHSRLEPEPPVFDQETVEQLRALDARFVRYPCYECGLDRAQHLVAPDEFGDLALYCVQLPRGRVIGSSGGSGVKKHLASVANGCSAIGDVTWQADISRGRIIDLEPRYGRPLPASEVRDRDWCSRCLPWLGREEFTRFEREQLMQQRDRVLESFGGFGR